MAKAAIGQICSSNSMAQNLAQCVKLVRQAAGAGAKILFLPEASDYIGTSASESLSLAQPMGTSPFVSGLRAAAAQHSIGVHVGIHVPVSVPSTPTPSSTSSKTTSQQSSSQTKLYNRTIYITPHGTIHPAGSYDKLHLFDYSTLRESASTEAGSRLVGPIPSPLGRLGSLICFDMRFPEPALHLTRRSRFSSSSSSQGKEGRVKSETETTDEQTQKEEQEQEQEETGPAQILLYPSAFTVPTGRAHWSVLLRARAIETQSYVIAAAQVGPHNYLPPPLASSSSSSPSSTTTSKRPRISYGHSMVIDPWGRVILEMKGVRPDWDFEKGEIEDALEDGAVGQLGIVDIELDEWERVREKMPLVRRTDIYPEL
ncbi:carbon-nitrogen hydrolase [Xylariaceae sp. FL0594]|nr:carbon-nitrogen hydrolase [Xylariaceae sp. FL0594]